MFAQLIFFIAALIICLSICFTLERLQKRRINQHNASMHANQPDESYNPQAIHQPDMQSYRQWLAEEDKIHKLGDLFQKLRYFERYNLSFERYLQMVDNGTWQDLANT